MALFASVGDKMVVRDAETRFTAALAPYERDGLVVVSLRVHSIPTRKLVGFGVGPFVNVPEAFRAVVESFIGRYGRRPEMEESFVPSPSSLTWADEAPLALTKRPLDCESGPRVVSAALAAAEAGKEIPAAVAAAWREFNRDKELGIVLPRPPAQAPEAAARARARPVRSRKTIVVDVVAQQIHRRGEGYEAIVPKWTGAA